MQILGFIFIRSCSRFPLYLFRQTMPKKDAAAIGAKTHYEID